MRYAIIFMTVAGCASLAACDQNPKSDKVTVNGQNGNVTISANGHQFSISANGDKNGSFSMSGDNGHFTMHASDGKQTVDINSTGGSRDVHVPDFVTSYPGAKQESISIGSNANGTSGTVTFETSDSPDAVIAFYKQKSADAGLAHDVSMNSGSATQFTASAGDGKRALQVSASASGSGAHVQVNWTGK